MDRDFPVVIPYVGLFVRDHWEEFTDLPFWYPQYGTDAQQVAWMRDLLDHVPLDWLPVPPGTTRKWFETHQVFRRDDRWILTDLASGAETPVEREPPGGTQVVPSGLPTRVRTREDLDAVVPRATPEGWEEAGCFELPRLVRRTFPDQCLTTSVAAPFWLCHGFLGFEGLMTAVHEDGALLTGLLARVTENAVTQVRRQALAGVYDVVWIEDCYSSADLISLDQFRRFALPYVARVVEAVNAAGMASVYYFCGKVDDRLEDLVELAPTAIALEESKKGFRVELGEVVQRVAGRCCVFGNLDAIHTLRRGTPDQVRSAICHQLEAGRCARRFVVSLGSPVTPDTSLSRVRDYLAWARALGSTPTNGAAPDRD
jgi:uroporphyrinogen-III decarboxylase